MALITTIITTYRRPQLLKKAIASALNQSFPDFQVCVYDNASGDETEAIVREFSAKDPRVQYHCHAENIGMMANYTYALAQLDTPYFSLLSDDDQLLPDFYATAMKIFHKHPEIAFCAFRVDAVDEQGRNVAVPTNCWPKTGYFSAVENIIEMALVPLLPVGILFQTRLVSDIKPNVDSKIQIRWDTDYLLQIVERHPYFITPTPGARFFAHADGFSTGNYRQMSSSAKKFEEHITATEHIIQRIRQHSPLPNNVKKQLLYALDLSLHNNVWHRLSQYKQQKLTKEAKTLFRLYIKRYRFRIFNKKYARNCLKHYLAIYAPNLLTYIQRKKKELFCS